MQFNWNWKEREKEYWKIANISTTNLEWKFELVAFLLVNSYYLPRALSLDPELRDAIPSGLCASRLNGVGGVSGFSICICSVICTVSEDTLWTNIVQ